MHECDFYTYSQRVNKHINLTNIEGRAAYYKLKAQSSQAVLFMYYYNGSGDCFLVFQMKSHDVDMEIPEDKSIFDHGMVSLL